MNPEPLVQVIIPTYNRPSLFKEALLSVLAQTYRNLSIFITDNSDNEETATLIRPFLELDARITYEHHPEFNEQDNWNRGMEMTRSDAEYVNWLMDDDLFFPAKIADMVEAFQTHEGLALVSGTRLHIDLSGRPIQNLGSPNLSVPADTRFSGTEAGASILKNQLNFIGEPTTALIRREFLLEQHRLGWTGHEGRYFLSDIPTWLHALEHGDLYFMKKPLSAFRLHDKQVGKQLRFLISLQSTWAYLIHHAATNGIYLTTGNDIRTALQNWTGNTSSLFKHADSVHYHGEDRDALQVIFDHMKSAAEDIRLLSGFTVQS